MKWHYSPFMALLTSTALVMTMAGPVAAQGTREKPKPKPETAKTDSDLTTVTVTAAKPTTKIDRDVYDPKTEPAMPNSNAVDVLNKAPGVNVDPEGNVTLRGNSAVQILVDGKPSALMQGNFRAITLQSLPADAIASIEVMTTPSAQFSADGGGGIINIVMKKNRTLRPILGMRLGAGNEGRYSMGVNAGATKGRLNVNGSLNFNRDTRQPEFSLDRERYTPTGTFRFGGVSDLPQSTDSYGFIGAAGFSPSDTDALGLEVTLNRSDFESTGLSAFEERDPVGKITTQYQSRDDRRNESQQGSVRLSFSHRGDTEGETLKADLRKNRSTLSRDTVSDYSFSTASPNRRTLRSGDNTQRALAMSVDYSRQLWSGVFTSGFELSTTAARTGNAEYDISLTTAAHALDTRRSNAYEVNQDQIDGYVTYQKALGLRWTVLSGLRVETTNLTLNQVTSHVSVRQTYSHIHPSFAIQYLLSETSKLRYNYGHRITRPDVSDLNPFIIYWDDRNARSGNPDLQPSETHLSELRYEYNNRPKNLTFTATWFYKKTENVFVERSTYIDDNLYLSRRENGGSGSENGLDLMYNRRIGTKWDVNLQTTFKRERRPPRSSTFTTITEAQTMAGGVRIGYRMSPNDQVQVSLNTAGKQLTGQGYTEPTHRWSVSYSRRINGKLTATASLQDHSTSRSIIENQAGHTVTEFNLGGLNVMFGLQINPFGISRATR
ncbi:TonB-dependent receptor [Asticcacaulis excentricus]|uniref:TonB-dependent receptor n=1 Tax=Asticcacaulis excentricus (strain ATCC 15261 / DSM 4724 / KCTC 12464 / NCIMB 9791 / VKM B-1370 / CB 48) TaxID=573065 RepID=E8RQY6_ASTEC|nr:TonB-dependent receptor [Asticcacaulis excentricus]ADU12249.1 TonB-dependent receptor [Asticcacaulis excentricus CB 48]